MERRHASVTHLFATSPTGGSLAVATLLVDFGADPRIPGWMQLTALHKAEERKDQEGQRVYALLKSVADHLGDAQAEKSRNPDHTTRKTP